VDVEYKVSDKIFQKYLAVFQLFFTFICLNSLLQNIEEIILKILKKTVANYPRFCVHENLEIKYIKIYYKRVYTNAINKSTFEGKIICIQS
jgi:hypothetical protein